jgi:ABC-type glycerol-3-phosphate transport system substrate-binding protein
MMRQSAKSAYMCGTILVLLIFIMSCAPDEQVTQVSLTHYFTGSLSAGIEEVSKELDDRQSGLSELIITPLEHEAFKTAIRLQLESPNPPDLFSYWAGARTDNLYEHQSIAPIDRLFDEIGLRQQFDPPLLERLSYDGRLYMAPLTVHYVGFFYHLPTFRRLGLDEPATWNQFQTVVSAVRDSGGYPVSLGGVTRWPIQFWFDYPLLRTQGHDFRRELMAGAVPMTDQRVEDSLEPLAGLLSSGAVLPGYLEKDWDEAVLDVAEGRAAMTLMGSWAIGYLNGEDFVYGEDYGFFPFPQMNPDIPPSALGPVDGLLLSAGSANVEAALEVLGRFLTRETQARFAQASGGLAPRLDVDQSIYSPAQQRIQQAIAESRDWAFNFDLATPSEQAEIGLDKLYELLNRPDDLPGVLREWQEKLDSVK